MPMLSQVHVDAALSNFAVMYKAPGLLSDRICPIIPVQKSSDYYYKVDPYKKLLREADTLRGLSSPANRIDWATTTGSYSCQEHCLEHWIDDRLRRNADPAVNVEQRGTQAVLISLGLTKEIALATALASDITATAAAAAYWTLATSDPVSEIKDYRLTVRASAGKMPNVAWCDLAVYLALLNHPDIFGRIQYVREATPMNVGQTLAGILGFDEILVGDDTFKNTAAGSAETASLSAIWGKTFWMAYVDRNPGLDTQTLGATFQVAGGGGASAGSAQLGPSYRGIAIDNRREEGSKSDVIRGTREYDQATIDATLGYRISACIA